MGRRAKQSKGKPEAKRPLARKPPKGDGAKVRDLEKRLAEALQREAEVLEQQTATAEILRVISTSPTELQPVFDAIAAHAMRLCRARHGVVLRFDGEFVHLAALANASPEGEDALRRAFPTPPGRHTAASRAILTGATIDIPDVQNDPDYGITGQARTAGYRSIVAVPMLREGQAIGTINVHGADVGQFSDRQVRLLQTFADQAVIAVENVRLFTELQARNRELTQSLEQQTATAEILRVISASPTDVQPVLDTIVKSAVTLCRGRLSSVFRFDGELLHFAAHHNFTPEGLEAFRRAYPRPLEPGSALSRAIHERRVVHLPDTLAEEWQLDVEQRARVMALGLRSLLSVPMLRDGVPIGGITVGRVEPGPFSDDQIDLLKTFADQAVIAIENVRLFTELQASNRELTTALDTQTATSDILRVISSSPTDLQPVLDAMAESATRLCASYDANIFRLDGDVLRLVAHHGPLVVPLGHVVSATRGTVTGRAVLDRQPVQVADLQTEVDEFPDSSPTVQKFGYRTTLGVPLLREGKAIGAISLRRTEVQPFTEREITLLQTFADQAVIAIENVRLFTELQQKNEALTQAHAQVSEALDQQTATSEILRAIASSPTDVQPVFDTISDSARRLLRGHSVSVSRVVGDELHLMAFSTTSAAADDVLRAGYPMRLDQVPLFARVLRERTSVIVADIDIHPDVTDRMRQVGRVRGFRSFVWTPMVRDDAVTGIIAVTRREAGAFSATDVALLQTFGDQAVIAIENVRLFTELQQKNEALTQAHAQVTEALEQQTATSEILRVIASSPTDVQPVFDTIVRSAVQLCDGLQGVVDRFDGELIHFAAHYNYTPEALYMTRQMYPRRPDRQQAAGRAILTGAVVNIDDAQADPEYSRDLAVAGGWRSILNVPMLREGRPIGAIGVLRAQAGRFSDAQVELLKTFADQAVIAIENVRLFKELEARTQELTRSVGELTALGEVGRALSSTLDLETVLQTIVTRAVQIAGTAGCTIWEYDEGREEFRLRVSHYADPDDAAILQALGRAATIPRGQGVTTRVVDRREAAQIADITTDITYESPIRRPLIDAGHRALLGVPLLSEDEVIGVLAVTRKTPGKFEPETVRLLSTFATQSALAIQNARLFLEIEDKSRQLEVASQHKSEFLANMSHELRTPLNAILGFSEVLADGIFGEINEKQAEYLHDILESGRHLLSLINDILDLSKIEAGRMELEPDDFDLPSAIDNALTLVRERAGRRGITLGREIDARVGMIRGDERKVKQVVLNLLSNAIKFTPEGGRIDVRAGVNEGLVEVSVADTGVGIAREDQETVFEEFRQVGTADKKVEGTGLGLALSRKFVELHGGRIWVKSQVGQGSTFTFTLPVRRGE
jgi:GAF domain-containing protein